jgi:dTDP-4-dehydrorhamnose 3,5-epimerase
LVHFWCSKEFEAQGLSLDVAQINISHNAGAGTLRGLHYQCDPHAEAKLVACTRGRVFDVAVDVRPDSPTYLQWFGTELDSEKWQMLYIPKGFAHGYQTLENDTNLLYLVSEFYAPGSEAGLRYDDPAIGIDWPLPAKSLSDKDKGWDLIPAKR